MKEQKIAVKKHFDPQMASMIVQTASQYKCHISLIVDNSRANAKSIMGIISLSAIIKESLTIMADGEDEQEAIIALEELIGG